MRLLVPAVVLSCASCLIAQTKVEDTPSSKPTAAPQATIQKAPVKQASVPGGVPANLKAPSAGPGTPPSAPVVTLQGVCKEPQAKSACKTVITREELDRFVSATAPSNSEAARGRMAVQYARTLAFSALAEQQGLAKNPAVAKEVEAQLKVARARILANAFLQSLQKPMVPTPDSEIQNFYDTHRDRYEQIQVRRLSVPLVAPTESGRRLENSAVKAEMEELRKRAAAGEDFNQLQQDAYQHLHIQATPPPVNLVTLRRSSLQGEETKVFDLNPGEMTAVLDLPAAIVIIKLESKQPTQIESVRQEIEAGIRAERMQIELNKLTKPISATFDLQYLELASQPDIFGSATITPAPTRIRPRARSAMRQ